MTSENFQTHPNGNLEECWGILCQLFPGTGRLTYEEQRLWKIELGGRPASACINVLRELKLKCSDQYLPISTFVSRMDGGALVAAQSYERTQKYMADMKAGGERSIASRRKNLEWCRARKAENPAAFAKLHEAAVNDWGVINPATRKKWLDADPCESLAVASLVRAHC